MSRFLTYPQAIIFLSELGIPITEPTLRRMVSERRIPHTKLDKRVLFSAEQLESFLASRAVASRKPRV